MALTDTAIRNAKARAKPYKLGDSEGLFLLVQPTGGKSWKWKYRIHGKEKKLSLGAYPTIGLAEARELMRKAKAELTSGMDPAREKQRRKVQATEDAGNTFASVAADFFDKRRNDGSKAWSPATAAKNEWLYGQLAPALGAIPIADIEPLEVLAAVRKIEARGNLESARRALQLASLIFRHGVATARLKSDPTRDLKGALRTPETKHRAAILDPAKLGELLRAIDGYGGHYTTKFALELAPHVFLRPGELRQAHWSEIDLEAAVWAIPAARTKMRKPHHVPLSRQALALLRGLHALSVRHDGLVFPSIRSRTRPLSENTLNAALRRLGFTSEEVSAHGFRSTASTMLNEALDPNTGKPMWSADAIEKALAHGGDDKIRSAWRNREKFAAVNRRLRLIKEGGQREEIIAQLRKNAPDGNLDLPGWLAAIYRGMQRMLFNAAMPLTPQQMLVATAGLFIVVFALLMTAASLGGFGWQPGVVVLLMVLALCIGVVIPWSLVAIRGQRRRKRIEEQFPIALDVFVRALRSGHPVASAIDLLTHEMEDPIGTEFGLVADEVSYGAELTDALQAMAERWDNSDMRMFVVSLSVQSETGGNLAEILENLAEVIRARASMFMKVRALSSEGRLTAWMLTVLPILSFIGMFFVNPGFYLDTASDPIFIYGFAGLILLYFIGLIWIRRMIDLKV